MAVLEWGFGVDMRITGVAPPPNLRPPRTASVAPRSEAAEQQLAEALRVATGSTGMWLAEGLKLRVESGAFGDWAVDVPLDKSEHRGVVLLDLANTDAMLRSAKALRADAMLAFVVTFNRDAKSVNNVLIELYDVAGGSKLWESKPLSTNRLRAGQRQGKAYDSELAAETLQVIDQQIALHPMPKLSPEAVRARLAAIRAGTAADPLSAMLELRYYLARKLITEADALDCSARWLAKETAQQLWSPNALGRQAAVESLLARVQAAAN